MGTMGTSAHVPTSVGSVVNEKQTDQKVDAQLVDSVARWILFLVVSGMVVFTLVASYLAVGLLEFTVRVWFVIGQAVAGWFTW